MRMVHHVKARTRSVHLDRTRDGDPTAPRPIVSPLPTAPRSSSLPNKENMVVRPATVHSVVRHYKSMLDVDPPPSIQAPQASTDGDFFTDTVEAVVRSPPKPRVASPSGQQDGATTVKILGSSEHPDSQSNNRQRSSYLYCARIIFSIPTVVNLADIACD